MERGTQQASRAPHYIAEDDDIMLSMLDDGQAPSDDIALEDIIELSDDIMVDVQSMLDDIIELSIMELEELCARLGNAAEAKAPATRNAPAIKISFFISEPRRGGFTTVEDS